MNEPDQVDIADEGLAQELQPERAVGRLGGRHGGLQGYPVVLLGRYDLLRSQVERAAGYTHQPRVGVEVVGLDGVRRVGLREPLDPGSERQAPCRPPGGSIGACRHIGGERAGVVEREPPAVVPPALAVPPVPTPPGRGRSGARRRGVR